MPPSSTPAPPRIARLVDALEAVQREHGIIGGRVAWKTNRAGEYVIALLVPAEFGSTSVRARDALYDSERERKRMYRQR